jgi:hypothetical protein
LKDAGGKSSLTDISTILQTKWLSRLGSRKEVLKDKWSKMKKETIEEIVKRSINEWGYNPASSLCEALENIKQIRIFTDILIANLEAISSGPSVCADCDAQGLVCEDHPEVPWNGGEGCCGGAGQQCKCQVTPKPTTTKLLTPTNVSSIDEKELEDAANAWCDEDGEEAFIAGYRFAMGKK